MSRYMIQRRPKVPEYRERHGDHRIAYGGNIPTTEQGEYYDNEDGS